MSWKPLAKQLAYWSIPPGLQDILRYCLTRNGDSGNTDPTLCTDMEAEFARNKKFHNLHRGERCFILATGPSIKKQDLKPLKNEICLAVSMFFLHKDIREIDPLYHVEAPNHFPYGIEVPQKLFEGYNNFYSDRTTYFLGHAPYEYSLFNFLEQNPQFKKAKTHYLNYCLYPPLNELNYNNPHVWDICKPLFAIRTVVYAAIQVAAYMGFKDIYLLGCDHNYLVEISGGNAPHFYEKEKGIEEVAECIPCEKFFLSYHLRWKQYRLMRQYLESRGCYIYNATEGGLLDVFPRVTLAEALAGDHEKRSD